jgi:hypothetical protein
VKFGTRALAISLGTILFSVVPSLALSQAYNAGFGNINDFGLTSGNCVQASTLGLLTTTGSACGSGGGGSSPLIPAVGTSGALIQGNTNAPNQGLAVTTLGYQAESFYSIPIGTTIGHLNVSCESYNAADAASGNVNYTSLDANGLGGGTIQFGITNGTYSIFTPFSIGSVIIPTSPQAGPWVTSVTSSAGTPYTILSGDNLVVTVSAIDNTATQWANLCNVFVGG